VIQPVILCGGSGTRLWPLSRKSFPKQFVPLVAGRSLLSLTLERVGGLCGPLPEPGVLCVGAEEHRFLVSESLESCGVRGEVLLEPVARNTAAAMAMAALHAQKSSQLMLFCPSDHHIPDADAFRTMVTGALPAARDGAIVTFGVTPSWPATGYGYIELGAQRPAGGHDVRRFTEKPDAQRAQALLLQGGVLWNAGIFLCKAGTLMQALARHAPDILARCRQAMADSRRDGIFIRPAQAPLADCASQSIDYAVMEHHRDIAVFPFSAQWSDVGSWNAVAQMTPADAQGNRIEGHGMAVGCSGVYLHAPQRCVVALGLQDVLVVDTPDAVLVARSGDAEKVRDVVAQLEARGLRESAVHRKVSRPWGSYDSVDEGPRFQVKRIVVKPQASLSLQKHYHRAEHWVVVKGTAEVTRGDQTFLLTENQSTYIPLGEVHRLRNPGRTPLELIEVQSGSYLGEDDIVRLDDAYGRRKEGE